MVSGVGFIGGLGPVEIGVLLSLLLILAFLYWLIRRPISKRIDELEEKFEDRLDDLEETIDESD